VPYPPFTVFTKANNSSVSVAGISDTPIDISSKTRLATFVFKAEPLVKILPAGIPMYDLICIEPGIAKVDGADASVILPQKCIPVASELWEIYDENGNGKIETVELIAAIQDWLNNKLSTMDLIKIIQKWLQS
jgi:hypothetical protein